MFHLCRPPREASGRPHVHVPLFMRFRFRPLHLFFVLTLIFLILGELLSNLPTGLPNAFAAGSASLAPPAQGKLTYQQFLKQGRDSKYYHGKVQPNFTAAPSRSVANARAKTNATVQPKALNSVQSPTMQPLTLPLTATALTANQTGATLSQVGSDKRLEVQVAPGSLDASHVQLLGNPPAATTGTTPTTATPGAASPTARATATLTPTGTAAATITPTANSGGVTLQITQKSGHASGVSSTLGVYDLEFVDGQGHALQGVAARKAVTLIYHYQPKELRMLNIDPGKVVLTWPNLIAAARKAKQPTSAFVVHMTNNAKAQTLTAQMTVLGPGIFALGSVPTTQQPPKAHLASVQGNSGNLTYSYPIQMPPGPGGFGPNLAFNYSSSAPNERHSPITPADSMGDGWTLGLGSISVENYPDSSADGANTWYSLSGPDGVSDKLVQDPNTVGSFFTEHVSHEKILGTDMNNSGDTPSCFHVWDTSGTYYEYGCTPDSLQYSTDSSGNNTTYRWDLDLIVPAREGPNAAERQVKLSYFQYSPSTGTGVEDAVLAQVVYQTVPDPSNSSNANVVGTIDFQYLAPGIPGTVPKGTSKSWINIYANNSNYTCSGTTPAKTKLRCDDPIDTSGTPAPTVMSVFSLQNMTVYVGADSANHPAYGYAFQYKDTPFVSLEDPITQNDEYGAGEHLLTTITPSVYQGGTAHALKDIDFSYTNPGTSNNTYYDSKQTANDGSTQYQVTTTWEYLTYYVDLNTNIGESVTYEQAYSNTHGTPYVTDSNGVITDDRHDPFYCVTHKNDSDKSKQCVGKYAHPDDESWSVQVVTNREALGKDSGDPNLQPATYNYTYTLGTWGTYQSDFGGSGTFCSPAGNPAPTGESDCTFDTFIRGPNGGGQDEDWRDFFHGEYRGFAKVYTTPPDGDLEVQTFYTPESWGTPESDANNYQTGSLIKQDIYWGNAEIDGQIVEETVNQYSGTADFLPAGSSPYSGACMSTSVSASYTPCEVVQVFTKTTAYEQEGTATVGAPWKQETSTYDDYTTSGGLSPKGYHNLLQKQTTSNNAATTTEKWTYTPTNSTDSNNYVYYTVNKATHHELDDASGHIWKCSDTTYDEGVSGIKTPSAGWPTTVKTYANCSNTSSANTTYTAYDLYGNSVGTVDAFGAANSSIYGSKGCTLATAPVVLSSAWTAGHYTSCSVYDSYGAQATSQTNVLGQTSSEVFDDTQGRVPTSSTDITGQNTSVSYSIDSNKNELLQDKDPGETGTYTTQSGTNSTCVFGSNRPCYEVDAVSAQYPGAVSRTFYDAQGNATETRKPLDATHDLVTFTIHNEWNDSTFVSAPFRVASGSAWLDPNGATDDSGNAPTGTMTVTDPLARVIATRDAIEGTSAEPGITCGSGNVTGTWTSCVGYGLGSPDPNSSTQYDYAVSHDANNHMTATFKDELGQTRFTKTYSANGSINSNITSATETQYNGIGLPTAVIVTDSAPQAGQSVTSVTTTQTYNDLGQLTSVADPDRGTHSYTYDADGRQLTDVSGSRTIGTSYDLLGRSRCVQDAAPTTDGSGTCSSGSHPLVQNSYDSSSLQLSGTTNYITGRLGQSVATTYYPDGTAASTTQQFEYDQRGNTIATNQQLSVPGGWNVTTALPTSLKTIAYNDKNQITTTKTTVGGAGGYTFTQVYDPTSGELDGLSTTSTGTANLVSSTFTGGGLISDLNFLSSTGTALANEHMTYDGDQRPFSLNATWQSGSGASGTLFTMTRAYDPAGNVASVSLTQAAAAGLSGSGGTTLQNFCYDEENRLLWAGNTGTQPAAGTGTCGSGTLANSLNGATYTNTFAYTHLGQIWQAPLAGKGSSQQYLYCSSGHPHQATGVYPSGTTCATTNGSTASYSAGYDAWGNLTSRTTGTTSATLSYDVLDHLVQWTSTDSSSNTKNRQEWYAYDATGNRVLKRSSSGGTTGITTYAFGLEEHNYDGSGNRTSNTSYYTFSGQLIGQTDGMHTQLFMTDALGSVLATFSTTAGSATVLANQAYGPYGTLIYSAGSMGTSKGFTGQYGDATGLDYYNARYYDPVLGRFLSADTVQSNAKGDDPYDYVGGNPETHNDPTGHCWPWCTMAIGAVVGAAISAGISITSQAVSGHGVNWGEVGKQAVQGAVTGAISGLAGPGAGLLAHTAIGAASGAAGQLVSNLMNNKPVGDGVATAAVVGGVTGVASEGAGALLKKVGSALADSAAADAAAVKNVAADATADANAATTKEVASEAGAACGLSFAANTPVTTPQGTQAISTLQVGDHVQAFDPATKTVSTQTVQNVFINHDTDLIDVTLVVKPQGAAPSQGTQKQQQTAVKSHGSHAPPVTTETVHTTQNHPWLTTKGWVVAGSLHLGDQVQRLDGGAATVVALNVILGSEDMYDLTVSNLHTFAVGNGQWVVHNNNCDPREQYVRDHLDTLVPDHGGDVHIPTIGEYGARFLGHTPDLETKNAIIEVTGENADGTVPGKLLTTNERGVRQIIAFAKGTNPGQTVHLLYEGDLQKMDPKVLQLLINKWGIRITTFDTSVP